MTGDSWFEKWTPLGQWLRSKGWWKNRSWRVWIDEQDARRSFFGAQQYVNAVERADREAVEKASARLGSAGTRYGNHENPTLRLALDIIHRHRMVGTQHTLMDEREYAGSFHEQLAAAAYDRIVGAESRRQAA